MEEIHREILSDNLPRYQECLEHAGLSKISVRKYIGDITRFLKYLREHDIRELDGEIMNRYRKHLEIHCSLISCNSYFISLNKYFKFISQPSFCMKLYRVAPKQSLENVLSLEEYYRLLRFTDNQRYYRSHMIMKTLGCTGIRISELKYITYESLLAKKTFVTAKSRTRTVYFSEELCRKLLDYCQRNRIESGVIFHARGSRRPLENGNIWRALKAIARKTGVDEKKVYPHSFRHLFAKTYIEKFNALAELADILGHTSIETTRIYTRTTGEEKRERLNLLGL
ncbi:MAG: tyrosine-type recombinase/integrase [Clostridium sp.]|jgi:site-specific recombinase XerD|nr:tyrosine-type recombinase/integrase [Clostridium sp.]